jgi:hypothetical protein
MRFWPSPVLPASGCRWLKKVPHVGPRNEHFTGSKRRVCGTGDVKDVGYKKRKYASATDVSFQTAKIQRSTLELSNKVCAPAESTILDSCTSKYRAMLGQWRSYKVPLPILIQNPMDAPRPVRQQWLDLSRASVASLVGMLLLYDYGD